MIVIAEQNRSGAYLHLRVLEAIRRPAKSEDSLIAKAALTSKLEGPDLLVLKTTISPMTRRHICGPIKYGLLRLLGR
jgi:hypothetical protein